LNDQKKRNKKKSPANILDYPLMARLRNKRKLSCVCFVYLKIQIDTVCS